MNKLYLGTSKGKDYYYNHNNWNVLKHAILTKDIQGFYDMLSNCNQFDRMEFFLENESRMKRLWNAQNRELFQLFKLFYGQWAKERRNVNIDDDDV